MREALFVLVVVGVLLVLALAFGEPLEVPR
jgi:hypothetical protein